MSAPEQRNQVFVACYMRFDYKPGHCDSDVIGIFSTFDAALMAALEESSVKVIEDRMPTEPPKTETELKDVLSRGACVWAFKWGEETQFWDGEDLGSMLFTIRKCALPDPKQSGPGKNEGEVESRTGPEETQRSTEERDGSEGETRGAQPSKGEGQGPSKVARVE
uniref:Uncharacterized protein n=1 Tax=Chromera velia CCMP2878 TaxID=1169474 RepID=A0A0G4HFB6_9ALVE|mmetsp:Transcript_24145/g.47442  ORF Transcript_24145/g.47442 Transcript_24145/m.47442 type:complete len:165 (+) Transcript_24145:244-738(+)|eukprot:Cvel_6644.t1-p1 / transcript=Cvel_6644.t1 / gene=Cvel_6644 / organism=Chromera_velia_CCMP2878 / gene_product=hypothetical protein / transcript_product=hypothetical protein / location=Cvel_scaffold329:64675-65166(+) / protein_length=164 / sequence_SO=supercontig / SO=protein_coding / is_pseudo=false